MKTQNLLRCSPILLMVFIACKPAIPPDELWLGEANIAEGRTIPFRLELDLSSDPPSGAFLVSNDRTPIPEIAVRGDSIILMISEYDAAIRLSWNGQNLVGRYERYRSDTTGMAVSASPAVALEKPEPSTNLFPLVGTFRVWQVADEGADTSSSAVFWSRGDSVFGTVVAPSGDDGLFAGVQSGDTVRLARFTGWQSIYMEIIRDGFDWEGRRFMRELPPDSFRLARRASAEPFTPSSRTTRLKPGLTSFTFSGVTPDGDTLTDKSERFRGKALIVDIMGTWCHNCLDAAPVLQRLYEEFGPRGLEVVSLAFELTDDPVTASKNLRLFADRHGVTYPLLFTGDLSSENVRSRIGSQLEHFGAYPTTLFIDRSGRIRNIHKGFRGPGTADGFQREVEYFIEHAREITQ